MTLNRTVARLPFIAAAALVTVTSFTLTAPAQAAGQAAPVAASATAVAVAASDPSTKICVVERLTGSRIDKKICRTKAQWEARGGLPTK